MGGPCREAFQPHSPQAEWRALAWAQEEAVKPLGPYHVFEDEAIQATDGPRSGPQMAVATSPVDASLMHAAVLVACALDGAEEGQGVTANSVCDQQAIIEPAQTAHSIIARMWAHVAEARVQAECLRSLDELLQQETVTQDDFMQSNGLTKMFMGLFAHVGDQEVMSCTLTLLWRLGRVLEASQLDKLGSIHVIQDVCIAMKVHLHCAEVQLLGCRALWSVAGKHPANKARAASAEAISTIACSMEVHRDDVDVQKYSCEALASICDADAPEVAGEAAAIVAVASMRRYVDDADLQAKACAALASLTHSMRGRAALDLAKDAEVVQQLSLTMKAHRDSAHVQQEAFAALRVLALSHGDAVLALAREVVRHVCDTLELFRAEDRLQVEGFGALRNLCSGTNPTPMCMCIGAAGGVERVCEGMIAHPGNRYVQEQGCGALWSLACHMENRGAAAEAQGIALVCQAMHLHRDVAGVQAQACGALHNLSCKASNPERIEKANGVQLLEQALDAHLDDPIVQEEGKRALARIMLSGGSRTLGNLVEVK